MNDVVVIMVVVVLVFLKHLSKQNVKQIILIINAWLGCPMIQSWRQRKLKKTKVIMGASCSQGKKRKYAYSRHNLTLTLVPHIPRKRLVA